MFRWVVDSLELNLFIYKMLSFILGSKKKERDLYVEVLLSIVDECHEVLDSVYITPFHPLHREV